MPFGWIRERRAEGIAQQAAREAGEAVRAELDSTVRELLTENAALESRVAEIGPGTDPNAHLWRRIGGRFGEAVRDVLDAERLQYLKLSHRTYMLRPDAKHLIELALDFVLGNELAPSVRWTDDANRPPEEVQKALAAAVDDIWASPANGLDVLHEDYVRTSYLDGELFLSVSLDENGHSRLGYVYPEEIQTVEVDHRCRDLYAWRSPPQGGTTSHRLRYFILNNFDPATTTIELIPGGSTEADIAKLTRGSDAQPGELTPRYRVTVRGGDGEGDTPQSADCYGLVFARFVGRPKGATRGRPVLLHVFDQLDLYERVLWAAGEREAILRAIVLLVKSEDVKDKASGLKLLRNLALDKYPAAPTVKAVGKDVEIEAVAPNMTGSPNVGLENRLLRNIAVSMGYPPHWMGDSSGSTLASTRAMDVVPMRRMRRLQREECRFWRTVIQVQLSLRAAKGSLVLPEGFNYAIEMNALEVGGRDKERASGVLRDVAKALLPSADHVLSRVAVNRAIVQLLSDLGVRLSEAESELPDEPERDLEAEARLLERDDEDDRAPDEGNDPDDPDTDDRQEDSRTAA